MSRLALINGKARWLTSLRSIILAAFLIACEQSDPTEPAGTKPPNPEAVKAVFPCSRDVQTTRDAQLVAAGKRIEAIANTAHALAEFHCGLRPNFEDDPKVPIRQ